MKDYMVRASAAGNFIRAFAVTSKGVTEAARAAHNLSPVCSAALGRTMAAGLMMGSMMKGEKDVLTVDAALAAGCAVELKAVVKTELPRVQVFRNVFQSGVHRDTSCYSCTSFSSSQIRFFMLAINWGMKGLSSAKSEYRYL